LELIEKLVLVPPCSKLNEIDTYEIGAMRQNRFAYLEVVVDCCR
jgi:hypothetical protein